MRRVLQKGENKPIFIGSPYGRKSHVPTGSIARISNPNIVISNVLVNQVMSSVKMTRNRLGKSVHNSKEEVDFQIEPLEEE